MHRGIRLYVFLLACLPGLLAATPIVLSEKNNTLETTQHLSYFADNTYKLTISDVNHPAFSNNFTSPPPYSPSSFGRTPTAHWVKFEVINQSNLTWYLVINSVVIAKHNLYIINNNTPDLQQLNKHFTRIRQRLPTYRLTLEKSTAYTVYLRMDNKGKGTLFAPIQLINADKIQQKFSNEALFFGCMVMGIIAMTIYNLFLFIRLRDRNYLTLALTQAAMILIMQRLNNVLPIPINVSNPSEPYFYLVFLFFMGTSITLTRSLLNTKNNDPIVDKFLYILLIFVILSAPLFHFIPRTDLLAFITGLVISSSALILMIKKQLEGDSVVKVFFIATSIFIAGSLPIVAWGLNLTSSFNDASYIFHISTFFSSIMMSLALAEKTRQMKRQTDQAQAANKAKTEFLTTMSHELRTPMHAVTAVSSLMKLTSLSKQQENYIEKLHASSQHMMSIIERVLDLSRLENNSVTVEKKPFQLKEILEGVEQLLSDQARQKNLNLYMHSSYANAQLLEGDPTRLSQILLNLLGNAIKFTDKGYVSLLITPLLIEEHYAALTFEVIDTGNGLSQKQQEGLFKPFTQVDGFQRGGFGLGLAISDRLVTNMGGYLDIESSPGNGSRFFFTLTFPKLKAAKPTVMPPDTPAQSLVGLRILLVDDDEINRFLGQELLQAFEADAHVADSGKTTLQLLEQHDYDLVLIDINMPEMDGYETTRHIRSKGLIKLPIIALTAHAISGERDRCLQAGMNDYLTKPFETTDLLTMIRFWTYRTQKP